MLPNYRAIKEGNVWRTIRGGIPAVEPSTDPFIPNFTMPTKLNTGVPAGTELTQYDPTGTLTLVNINTPGVTYEDVDFGNCRVNVTAANVTFRRCRWTIINQPTPTPTAVIFATSGAVFNLKIEQCDIINLDHDAYKLTAVQGHHFDMYRVKVTGFHDCVNGTGGIDWKVRSCFLSELGWWYFPTGGYAHPKDQYSHADVIVSSFRGGTITGNFIGAYVSTVVGTGTPGSGNNTGWPESPYTQAEANATRLAQLVEMSPANKAADGISHEVLPSLCCFMINNAEPGTQNMNLTVRYNWFAGATGPAINGLATNTNPLGTFEYNRFFADMSSDGPGGKPLAFYVLPGNTATWPTSGATANHWMDDNAIVLRKDFP